MSKCRLARIIHEVSGAAYSGAWACGALGPCSRDLKVAGTGSFWGTLPRRAERELAGAGGEHDEAVAVDEARGKRP